MQLNLNLSNPNFTWLHRAGLAGLWMTLKQLDKEISVGDRPLKLDWNLTNRQIVLHWEGNDLEVLDWLLKASFQTSDEGLINLRGLNSKTMDIPNQWILHQGMLRTFLQHNSTHTSDGSKSINVQVDEIEIPVSYKSVTSYAHQDFAKNLCDDRGQMLKRAIAIAGWLNPGAVVRHTAFSAATSFEEHSADALLLLFAPVSCYYFLLKSKLRDKRSQYALVIPEIKDLEEYAKIRQDREWRKAGYKDFCATGLGDAAMRFLTHEAVVNTANKYKLQRCQVLTFGTVAWSSQQMTRTELYVVDVMDNPEAYENYQICRKISFFENQAKPGEKGGFISVSFARELIAENLAKSLVWYKGFSTKVNSGELFKKLTYDREGLYQMIQKAKWDAPAKKLFVEACHQAIGNTYGKAAGRAEDSNKDPNFERINVKLRSKLGRCKNAQSFRAFIADFWSRSGKVSIVQENWQELMELITESEGEDWKLPRDLFLLALASYKRKGKKDVDGNFHDDDEDDEEGRENEDGESVFNEWED